IGLAGVPLRGDCLPGRGRDPAPPQGAPVHEGPALGASRLPWCLAGAMPGRLLLHLQAGAAVSRRPVPLAWFSPPSGWRPWPTVLASPQDRPVGIVLRPTAFALPLAIALAGLAPGLVLAVRGHALAPHLQLGRRRGSDYFDRRSHASRLPVAVVQSPVV